MTIRMLARLKLNSKNMANKKILVINGSLRSGGQTKRVIDSFVDRLGSGYETEIVNLKDVDIKGCIGCAICLSKGEELCPLKDERNDLLKKMDEANGIVFASPNFSLHVTHLMKNFLDRHAFVFHRPRFFKQVFTSIITQGAFGGRSITKYFKTTAGFWGGRYVSGIVLTLPSASYIPGKAWSLGEQASVDSQVDKLVRRFEGALNRKEPAKPSLFRVMMFRLTRTAHKYSGEDNKDVRHFREQGWLEALYWYPVRLGLFNLFIGAMIDILAKKLIFKK